MVLGWPAGRFLVGAAGLVVSASAAGTSIAASPGSSRQVARPQLSQTMRKWGGRAGVLGHVAALRLFGLIGVFLVKAAIDYKPKDAIGLDGALQKLVHASYGPWLLGITAAGLVAYGIYCLVDARLRDVSANA